MARTSFNRHREEIEDVFGIRIICDRSNGWRYRIENADEMDGNTVANWMANTISLNNVIAENRSVADRILLENIPSEGANLQCVIEAMRMGRMIEFSYHKYHTSEIKHYEVEPYCVKLYHRRWYLLARYRDTKTFRVFGFDRIVSVNVSSLKFKLDRNFDASSYFNEFFGVAPNFDIPLQKIIVRAYNTEQFYMRDLPVHHSQKLIAQGDGFCDYELTLRPTDDFLGYILSRSRWIQVLSPQNVIDNIREMAKSVQNLYH